MYVDRVYICTLHILYYIVCVCGRRIASFKKSSIIVQLPLRYKTNKLTRSSSCCSYAGTDNKYI